MKPSLKPSLGDRVLHIRKKVEKLIESEERRAVHKLTKRRQARLARKVPPSAKAQGPTRETLSSRGVSGHLMQSGKPVPKGREIVFANAIRQKNRPRNRQRAGNSPPCGLLSAEGQENQCKLCFF